MGEKGRRGSLDGAGLRVGVVAARYNQEIVDAMLEGTLSRLAELGAAAEQILSVPGSFELPLAARILAEGGEVDAVVALGCVIKGDTAHFEYVAGAATQGLTDVALKTRVPVAFGVLTTYDEAQARARIDKGAEAADTAVEMANLLRQVRPVRAPS